MDIFEPNTTSSFGCQISLFKLPETFYARNSIIKVARSLAYVFMMLCHVLSFFLLSI